MRGWSELTARVLALLAAQLSKGSGLSQQAARLDGLHQQGVLPGLQCTKNVTGGSKKRLQFAPYGACKGNGRALCSGPGSGCSRCASHIRSGVAHARLCTLGLLTSWALRLPAPRAHPVRSRGAVPPLAHKSAGAPREVQERQLRLQITGAQPFQWSPTRRHRAPTR